MRNLNLLSAVLLLPFVAGLPGQREDRLSSQAEQLAQERKDAVLSETRLIQSPHWAGEYYKGDGLGVNVSLALAPRSGFVFEWHGCLGLYDRNMGSIEASGNRIVLRPEFPNERKGFRGIATDLYWIRWGDRSYLVPTEEVQDFCNDINAGVEPRDGAHGSFLLKQGDEKKATSGKPVFPDPVRDCVLDKPIEGKIVAVAESRLRASCCDFNFRDTEATIDVGRIHGVTSGMQLFVKSEGRNESAKVIDLKEETSTIMFVQLENDPKPQVGFRMSTRLHEEPK